jgi:hypothetical protein
MVLQKSRHTLEEGHDGFLITRKKRGFCFIADKRILPWALVRENEPL